MSLKKTKERNQAEKLKPKNIPRKKRFVLVRYATPVSNWRMGKKESFKAKYMVEISMPAQINNGKSLQVASNKSFRWWLCSRFRRHQRYLCPANYEDKMGGNRSILFLISKEMEAMANARVTDQQRKIYWDGKQQNITCTWGKKILTVLDIENLNFFHVSKQILSSLCCPLNDWVSV